MTASPLNAIIAVGDSIQVTATGATLTGDPITSFDSVRYVLQTITDTIRVRVSAAGIVTGRASSGSNPVLLNVYAFKGGLVRGDQVVIQVTDTKFGGATLSIQPTGGDSARLAQGSSKSIVPIVQNSVTNESVPNTTFRFTYRPTDASKLGCYVPGIPGIGEFTTLQLSVTDCGTAVGLDQIAAIANSGTAWVIAEANVYGTVLRDSVQYTLTNPYSGYVLLAASNLQVIGGEALGTVYLAPGGTVTFLNFLNPSLGSSVIFTFENPAAATVANPVSTVGDSTGNVTALAGQESSNRQFLTPGVYLYTATVTSGIPPFANASVSGKIVVE